MPTKMYIFILLELSGLETNHQNTMLWKLRMSCIVQQEQPLCSHSSCTTFLLALLSFQAVAHTAQSHRITANHIVVAAMATAGATAHTDLITTSGHCAQPPWQLPVLPAAVWKRTSSAARCLSSSPRATCTELQPSEGAWTHLLLPSCRLTLLLWLWSWKGVMETQRGCPLGLS